MKNAGKAMKEIHGGMTIDQVDKTMDELREQQQLGEEIANAITSAPIGEPVDEGELEDELEGLEQEMLDERMVKTGALPVGGELERAPAVPNVPGEFVLAADAKRCANGGLQLKARRYRRTTRKRNCGSCRLRWRCDILMRQPCFSILRYVWAVVTGCGLIRCDTSSRQQKPVHETRILIVPLMST